MALLGELALGQVVLSVPAPTQDNVKDVILCFEFVAKDNDAVRGLMIFEPVDDIGVWVRCRFPISLSDHEDKKCNRFFFILCDQV